MNPCPENRLLDIIKKTEENKKIVPKEKKKNYLLPFFITFILIILLAFLGYFVNKQLNKNNVIIKKIKIIKPDNKDTSIETIAPPISYKLVGLMDGDNPYVIIKKEDQNSLLTINIGEYFMGFKLINVFKKSAVFQKNNTQFTMRI